MSEDITPEESVILYQRKSIDALLSITKPDDEAPTIEKIFQKAVGPIQEISGFSTVTLRLYDPEWKCFRLMAQGGMPPEMVAALNCMSEDAPIFAEIMKRKEPAAKIPLQLVRDLGYKKTVFIPLIAGDAVIGSIDLPSKKNFELSEDEYRWFALVGRVLGSMIYQVQLTERLQNMAVITERTRLANELHDDVAQLVRSMRFGLEEAQITLENNQLDLTAQVLQNLENLVEHASAYLREEMLSLREKVNPNQGIIPIIEGMLLRFEKNWGIRTEFVKNCCLSASDKTMLSSKTEIQLIRIIQEALNNIRRHANAHHVILKISEGVNHLVFTISDDGIGFRIDNIPHESLGLRILHERAASIGAIVQIESIQNMGTTIKIELPFSAGNLV